jgi:hypothetical protein
MINSSIGDFPIAKLRSNVKGIINLKEKEKKLACN